MRWLLLPLLSLLLGGWSHADQRQTVEAYQLKNGMGVLFKPTREKGHVSIRLIVGVGFSDFSCHDRQLPHLMEHLFFSGLDGGDEADLEARMQALGGQWNAYTSEGDTAFVVESPAATQRQVLDLLLEIITRTRLDAHKLEATKQVLVREDGGHYSHLQRWLDHQNISRAGQEQLAVELGLACPERAPVEHLTQAQLEQLRRDWYVPGNMTLIIVGDLDPRLPLYLSRTYGALVDHETPERRDLPEMKGPAERERTLTTGMFGEGAVLHWIFPEPDDAEGAALDLLQAYLNDVLYTELRVRRELSYGPWSERSAWANQGFISLNADIERDDQEATLKALREVVEKIRHDGLDPARFGRIQRVARAQLAWSTPGNSTLADYYWGALADFDDGHFPDEDRRLAKVSLQQANEVAQKVFKDDGYLRIEKPLLDDDMVYPLVALATLVFASLLGLALWRRRS
ncbi:insulinase family protein [Pseudomonas sp. ZM23]|uniref:Pitrilysin family protein n=1 Tax=Pseudomonas triclosanedens TaxID=2961893 RepID=A0ABY6ZXE7_9PSED|nr:pitrilysin family protein [Pseudomonas triclosanedens]MCP8462460.1 insulinase family protein [Pseudomonas triclosanedens]MCP8468098.1 insulinase family protein [Pseudomonas triclosanedens]MCP8474857.1 insulinase family protein [Pseudomonas triclosanedens]WAI49654.1 pitrilysin family protein [Pseudomonas triclosanedens]